MGCWRSGLAHERELVSGDLVEIGDSSVLSVSLSEDQNFVSERCGRIIILLRDSPKKKVHSVKYEEKGGSTWHAEQ